MSTDAKQVQRNDFRLVEAAAGTRCLTSLSPLSRQPAIIVDAEWDQLPRAKAGKAGSRRRNLE